MVRSRRQDRQSDDPDIRAWRRCYTGQSIVCALLALVYGLFGILSGDGAKDVSTAAFFACFAILAAISRIRQSRLLPCAWAAVLVLFMLPQAQDVGQRVGWSTSEHLTAMLVVAGLGIVALLGIALTEREAADG